MASRTWLLTQSGLTPATNAPSGQSCSRLEQLAKPGGDRRASSAQAATLLTLGLRSQGIPARLAYGYRLGKQLPDGSYAPTARDAAAFTQVKLDPLGWVAIDAAPSEAPADAPQSDLPELDRQSKQPLGDHKTNDPGAYVPPSEPIPWLRITGLGLLAVVVQAACGWLLYAAGRRRRARRDARTQGDLRAQVVSAWTEAIAALAGVGVPVATATVAEVARQARAVPGASEAVWELGSLVERALYDPRADGRRLRADRFRVGRPHCRRGSGAPDPPGPAPGAHRSPHASRRGSRVVGQALQFRGTTPLR